MNREMTDVDDFFLNLQDASFKDLIGNRIWGRTIGTGCVINKDGYKDMRTI